MDAVSDRPLTLHPSVHVVILYPSDNDVGEMDIPQPFVVERDRFGKLVHRELKPNGRNMTVTNANKQEYVRSAGTEEIFVPFHPCLSHSRLYVQFRFRDGIEKQFMALQKGFHELIPPHLLKDFDERELELLISGLGKVDVEDWRANTRLKNCSPDTDTIKWFWKVSHSPPPHITVCISSSHAPLRLWSPMTMRKEHVFYSL